MEIIIIILLGAMCIWGWLKYLAVSKVKELDKRKEKIKQESVEIWRNIPGVYKGYKVSNKGNVISCIHKGKIITLKPRRYGGNRVVMIKNEKGKFTNFSVKRLVWAAFINTDIKGRRVYNKNGDKNDDSVENLELR